MASRERLLTRDRRVFTALAIALIVAASAIAYWPNPSGATPPAHATPPPIALKSRSLQAPADPREAPGALLDIVARGDRHAIVQLEEIPDDETREALERAGLKLGEYLGNRGWYATVSPQADESDLEEAGLVGAWSIEPADRLSPTLRRGAVPSHARRQDGTVAVSVLAFADVDIDQLRALLESEGALVESVRPEFDLVFVRARPGALGALAEIDGVQWIEPVAPTPAPEMNRARTYTKAEIVQQLPYGLTGTGIDVSVHDSGHAFKHNDYDDRWTQGDTDTLAPILHASMTAGTIAGDGTGNFNFKGMAPAAKIFTYSFASATDAESNNYGDIANALSRNLEIANNSWGYNGCTGSSGLPYGDYTSQARVYDLQSRGQNSSGTTTGRPMVVVFSAGNERDGFDDGSANNLGCIGEDVAPFRNYGTINQPKPAKNIIAVGAVDSANDRMSTFSSWGPTSDGRLKPDLVAPGVHNGTNVAGVSAIDNCFGDPIGATNQQCYRTTSDTNTNGSGTSFDDRYAWFSQTSAAAAMVSGAAALFIEDFRAQNGNAYPVPSTVKAHFIHTARDLDDATTWYNKGPDFASGYGVIDIQAAIDQMRTDRWIEGTVGNEQVNTIRINVPSGAFSVKVTLAWDDPPAAPATTGQALVNDLDLIVIDPAGNQHYPWTLNHLNPSLPALRTLEDHRNNVEVVYVDEAVTPGIWTVRVRGSVPSGSQKYSLVFSHPLGVSNTDLVVSALTAPSLVAPGQVVSISDTTRNQGTSASGASITKFYWSRNTTLDDTDVLLGQRAIPALSGGQSSGPATTSVTIPAGATNGSYYILAVADSADTVFESVETNNLRSRLVSIGPDLVVSALTGPAAVAPTATVSLKDTTKNQGSMAAASSYTRFYWSTNSTFGTGDIYIGERSVPSLSPGATSGPATTSVTIPLGPTIGVYYIVAVADGRSTVSETSEKNNSRSLKVGVGPDLAVTTLTAPSSVRRGVAFSISDTTKNQGSYDASPSTTRYYLSLDAKLDSGDVSITSRSVGTLTPGTTSTATIAGTVPALTPAGTYYLIVVADDGKVVTEYLETNNLRTKSISVTL